MTSAIAVDSSASRRLVFFLVAIFLTGYFLPIVANEESVTPLEELEALDSFDASARSGTGWSMMAAGSSNGNARYIDVHAATGDMVLGGQMDGGSQTISWDGISATSGDTVTFWMAGLDSGGNGSWVSVATAAGINSPAINPGGLAVADNGDIYITGSFRDTATFGSLSLTSSGLYDCFIVKLNSNGDFQWAQSLRGAADAQTGATTTLDVVWGTSITAVPGGVVIGGFYLGNTDVGSNAGVSTSDGDIFVAKYTDSGQFQWSVEAKGNEMNEVHSMASNMAGDVWLATNFQDSMTFGSHTVSASGSGHPVIAKIDGSGGWLDAQSGTTTSGTVLTGLAVNLAGEPILAGIFSGSLTMGSRTISSYGEDDGFITTFASGSWSFLTQVGSSTYDYLSDLQIDPSSGNAVISMASAGSISIAGQQFTSQGENDSIIASLDSTGAWSRMVSAHGSNDNWPGALAVDDLGNVAVAGTSSGMIDFSSTSAGSASPSNSFGPYAWHISGFGSADSDGDGVFDEDDNCPEDHNSGQEDHDSDGQGDACDSDDDDDGILDNNGDDCPTGELLWLSTSNALDPNSSTDWDMDGCKDSSSEDLDMDNDQKLDADDNCPRTAWDRSISVRPEWISEPSSDKDLDGCRDGDEDTDDDNDGVEDGNDNCPDETGTSSKGTIIGCPDRDGDGWADQIDDCPDTNGNSENGSRVGCLDSDGDGWADEIDALPLEPTQWIDSDGDSYGDNLNGNKADDCPNESGGSFEDRQGCKDSDNDGWSNPDVIWTIDDGADALPDNPTQWSDFDEDGFGDNYGNHSWTMTRDDSWPGEYVLLALNQDACPLQYGDSSLGEILGCNDKDGDGWADFIDAFPDDVNEYLDSDKDGFADGTDDCRNTGGGSQHDRKGCPDLDGDGWSDADAMWTIGNGADAFRDEPSQWADADGDGYGDNSEGIKADDCPDTFGTLDEEGFRGCPPSSKAKETEDDSLSEGSSNLAGFGDTDMTTMGIIIGGIVAVLILVVVLVRGGGEDEEYLEDEDDVYHQQYATAMQGTEQYANPAATHAQAQYQAPQQVQAQQVQPQHPDPTVVGQMRTDGNEWLEYPHSSGMWYSRDTATRTWVRRI